jgi:hypothetical protein
MRSSLSGIQTSGVKGGSLLTSRVENSREDQSRPSKEDRWQRSRDLTNLEVRKVRAQRLGAPSHKVVKSRGAEKVVGSTSRRTVGSGTPSRIMHLEVRRLRGPRLDYRSREVLKCRELRHKGTHGRTTRWGPCDR